MTTTLLKDAIRERHTQYDAQLKRRAVEGVLVFELHTNTGYAHGEPSKIDAFHMACRPSENLARTAYEVKASRSDFQREVKQPLKRRAALRVSNFFYFVTPPGLVRPEDVPLECGLLELAEGRLQTVVRAPHRDGLPPSWLFFAAFSRRLQRDVTRGL